jgi:glycosyltransferase involved in cell wall biosynthesis
MSQPLLVSVLMSVYNSERYVGDAIDSILNQTHREFEFVIIDDGSSDHTPQILDAYAAGDPRIRLLHRENRGIPKTRNELLALARGELIMVMDSDDIAHSDRLAAQVKFLQQNPSVVWVGGAFELMDDQGRLLTCIQMPNSDQEIQGLLVKGHTSFLHPTAMIRRSAILQVGGYDETFSTAHDLDLWLKLSEIGQLANLPQPVVKYRIHPDSICNRNQDKVLHEVQTAFDRAWDRRGIQARFQATIVCGWRPGTNPESQYEFLLKYGWWAFNYRQRVAALHYGLRSIYLKPFSLDGWKLLACAAVKPLPNQEQQ